MVMKFGHPMFQILRYYLLVLVQSSILLLLLQHYLGNLQIKCGLYYIRINMDIIDYKSTHKETLERLLSLSPEKYRNFNSNDFDNALHIAKGVVINNNEIIGAGFLKVVPEAIVIINP